MRIDKSAGWLLVLYALIALPAAAEEQCELRRYAELPVTMSGTRPIVHGTINGEPANFLADSGAFYSILSKEAAGNHHLSIVGTPNRMVIRGVTDSEVASMTTIKEFSLAGFLQGSIIKDLKFLVTNSATPAGADGIVGQNVLGGADTEFDFANGVIRLLQSKHCDKKILAYWVKDTNVNVASVELEERTPLRPQLIGSAMVNGKKIRVVFDTGARGSTITRRLAQRLGVKPEDESVKAAGNTAGLGKRMIESWTTRFDSMDIGGEKIQNARLRISDINVASDADMLLGADFFLSHRVYVAAQQNKLYFTYNGGPVFDLRENYSDHTVRSDAQTSAASDSTSNVATENSLSAAELRRRGAASAGRHEFTQALIDFDLAIKLDKDNPENYYQRGLAHWNNHEPELALSDFNSALAINPDNIPALTSRGRLLLMKKDKAGAERDFSAAARLAHDDPTLVLDIAESYGTAGYLDDLIEHLNVWLAANKKDERKQQVLNQRCHARLMLNKELDQALTDCDAAINAGSAYADIYGNRGLVYLRRNDVDKAMKDFKKALKLQPKDARSLYALGIAEYLKGQQADSEKDVQAALTIAPNITELFERMGIRIEHQ